MGFPLDIFLMLISMGNWGGVVVGFFCFLVSFFFSPLNFYSEAGGENFF